jgi:hypothetical protein
LRVLSQRNWMRRIDQDRRNLDQSQESEGCKNAVAPFNCASGSGMRGHLVSTTRPAGRPRKMSAPTSGDCWGTERSGPRIPDGGERHRRRATISALRFSSFLRPSMQGVRKPHGREGAIDRRPSRICKLDLQVASLVPGRPSPSGANTFWQKRSITR